MNKDVLISVNGVSKKFSKSLLKSLKQGLLDVVKTFLGIQSNAEKLKEEEFWALKDISFEVRRGECYALIGHNGAGKSTLLKMLNGLIKPDLGEIVIKGNVGALIELGAGFNPILSGRENIYTNGQVLGFSKKAIDEKMNEIIQFSEIGDFIDAPVQNYSSGMKVRLGFAIAAQMEPDVLLIDEVLAVGDIGFVHKCLNRIDNLLPNTAIIFVSHSMPMVSRICSGALLLDKGKEKYKGNDVAKAIDIYYSQFKFDNSVAFSDGNVELVGFNAVDFNEKLDNIPIYGRLADISFKAKVLFKKNLSSFVSSIVISDKEQRPFAITIKEININEVKSLEDNSGLTVELNIKIPKNQFSKGVYFVTFSISEKSNAFMMLKMQNIVQFQINSERQMWQPIEMYSEWS